jgi:hypothetical protein
MVQLRIFRNIDDLYEKLGPPRDSETAEGDETGIAADLPPYQIPTPILPSPELCFYLDLSILGLHGSLH